MGQEVSAFLGEPGAAGAQETNALAGLEDGDSADEGLCKHNAELLMVDIKLAC